MAVIKQPKKRCGVCYRDVTTEHGVRTHMVFEDDSVRCYAEPDRANVGGEYISAFVFTVHPEDDRREVVLEGESNG